MLRGRFEKLGAAGFAAVVGVFLVVSSVGAHQTHSTGHAGLSLFTGVASGARTEVDEDAAKDAAAIAAELQKEAAEKAAAQAKAAAEAAAEANEVDDPETETEETGDHETETGHTTTEKATVKTESESKGGD